MAASVGGGPLNSSPRTPVRHLGVGALGRVHLLRDGEVVLGLPDARAAGFFLAAPRLSLTPRASCGIMEGNSSAIREPSRCRSRPKDQTSVSADDHRLIAKCLGGDTAAFGELVRRYQDRLYNTVYRLVDN